MPPENSFDESSQKEIDYVTDINMKNSKKTAEIEAHPALAAWWIPTKKCMMTVFDICTHPPLVCISIAWLVNMQIHILRLSPEHVIWRNGIKAQEYSF